MTVAAAKFGHSVCVIHSFSFALYYDKYSLSLHEPISGLFADPSLL